MNSTACIYIKISKCQKYFYVEATLDSARPYDNDLDGRPTEFYELEWLDLTAIIYNFNIAEATNWAKVISDDLKTLLNINPI
ncbi:hypothetical protein E2K93_12490 [Thalassotalea sp. HSM 43]|uniref:hypothetical protein n=1 Tax=Thalassotalea sp. HSM 43 TaxID=2552945 RepID=UPI0010807397|nr:hypothetical protein [Thalassotalea sp. HSM 43]QBY05151.1 hypothetical protein E2K93_12490 [Thalassotalea sp. HSM 43]